MLKKIARKKFLQNYPEFPQSNNYKNKFTFPERYNSYILYVEAKSSVGICNNLSAAITKLTLALGYNELAFLGDSAIPWLFRDHDYKPVKRALNYLAENNISKSFSGAIQVINADLPIFLKHLFWLVRCNGVIFYPYFTDADFNIIANVCQYGGLHFSTLNEKTDRIFSEIVAQTGLHFSVDANCGGERIPGRTSTSF